MRRVGEESPESSRIMLGLLDAVEQDRAQSQRLLASELGIALGLVNAYLKRCIKKGLVKVRSAPARRYAYYLTPQGFAEKSRLTVDYLSYSFGFFRQAKTDCSELFRSASARGIEKVVLVGQTDLAEIAALCAMERGIKIAGVVQKSAAKPEFIGLPVFEDFDAVSDPIRCCPDHRSAQAARDLRRGGGAFRRGACARAGSVARPHAAKKRVAKMMPARPRWYVVQTQANAENKAVAHLRRQGFATYLPRYLKRRRHARRVDTVAAPLFPRYLFVEIDMAIQRWRSIYSTVGVSRLVCNGDCPVPVPDAVISSLRSRENASGFVQFDQRPKFSSRRQNSRHGRRILRLSRNLCRHAGPRTRRDSSRSARPQGPRAARCRGHSCGLDAQR